MADTSMEVVLQRLFLSLSNANFQFSATKLTWRSYTNAEALPTARPVKLIVKYKFAKAALDKNFEIFVVHVFALKTAQLTLQIHSSLAPLLAALQEDKALTKIPAVYANYAGLFSVDLAMELLKNTDMNQHFIELVEGKQPLYGPIYGQSLLELKTLKAYIKTHFKTGFIRPIKFPASALILFDKKLDEVYCYAWIIEGSKT